MPTIHIRSASSQNLPGFTLLDVRTQDARAYRQVGKTRYLGDSNFEIIPTKLIELRFNEELGDLLKGKEVSLLEFQARISAHASESVPDIFVPGTSQVADALGSAMNLPQLGNPDYANVSFRFLFQQTQFTGSKSIQFYFGSGESEIAEAFDMAVDEAVANLRLLLLGSLTRK